MPEARATPTGRGTTPKTDRSEHNKDRRLEGRRLVRWMRRIAAIAREILGVAPGTRDRRASAIPVSIRKARSVG